LLINVFIIYALCVAEISLNDHIRPLISVFSNVIVNLYDIY